MSLTQARILKRRVWEKMTWGISFFITSIMLGIGLAMDAFSVSLANGLNDHEMKPSGMCLMSGIFSGFQFLMPLIGWVCVHTVAQYFSFFEKLIPWIALGLLSFIGGKMLYEGIKGGNCEEGDCCGQRVCLKGILIQGIATSIDALSVGFTIAEYEFVQALVSCLLIGFVTFFICLGGIFIGKKFGTHLAGKAGILGGVILILIGVEIFLTGLFG